MRVFIRKREDTISYTTLLALLVVALVLLLIPILILSYFAVPTADDFSFSCETHSAVANGEGVVAILAGAFSKTAEVYYSWQGSFTAVFLMAFQPSIWGFRFYRLTTYIILIPLVAGIFFIVIRVFSGIFQADKKLSACIAAILAIICTQFLPSPSQGFYWYNGAIYYSFTFSVMLLFFASLSGYILYGGSWRLPFLCLLAFVIGGNNYVTALLSLILLFCTVILLLLYHNRCWKTVLIPFIILIVAFAVNAAAPGNLERQAFFSEHPGPLEAIVLSFRYAAHKVFKWFDLRLLACLIALLPFLWKAASENTRYVFRFPGIVTVFSFCLLASMFTPHVYAIGFDGPGRIQNIYYYAFVLLLVFNMFWWCGWILGKSKKKDHSSHGGIRTVPFLSFCAVALLCMACSVIFFHGSMTSIAALGELRSGEAQNYYIQALERQGVLEDPTVEDCVFSPFHETPYLLFFTDMTDDPSSYENEDTSTFYGKKSIIVTGKTVW